MHWQNRSQSRERDHKIALMPLAPPEDHPGKGCIRLFLLIVVLCIVTPFAVAILSTPRP